MINIILDGVFVISIIYLKATQNKKSNSDIRSHKMACYNTDIK